MTQEQYLIWVLYCDCMCMLYLEVKASLCNYYYSHRVTRLQWHSNSKDENLKAIHTAILVSEFFLQKKKILYSAIILKMKKKLSYKVC